MSAGRWLPLFSYDKSIAEITPHTKGQLGTNDYRRLQGSVVWLRSNHPCFSIEDVSFDDPVFAVTSCDFLSAGRSDIQGGV